MELHKKAKAENIKEVRKMERARKDKDINKLVNYLNCKWQYANNTAYKLEFRKYKIIHMINEITYFLHVDEGARDVITHKERYTLLCLIRALSYFTGQKSPANKNEVMRRLKDLEALSE